MHDSQCDISPSPAAGQFSFDAERRENRGRGGRRNSPTTPSDPRIINPITQSVPRATRERRLGTKLLCDHFSNACYSQLSPCGHLLLRTLAITDKIQIPSYRGLNGNDSRYYRLSLIRTINEVPSVSAITRVDFITNHVRRHCNTYRNGSIRQVYRP